MIAIVSPGTDGSWMFIVTVSKDEVHLLRPKHPDLLDEVADKFREEVRAKLATAWGQQ